MAVGTMPLPAEKAEFRTCPVTNLKVDLAAERLIIANAVVAVVALLIGGVGALLLALTRWQAIHLLSPEWFYRILTAQFPWTAGTSGSCPWLTAGARPCFGEAWPWC